MGGSQQGGQSCRAQQTLAELAGLLLTLDLCTGRSHALILTAPGHGPSFVQEDLGRAVTMSDTAVEPSSGCARITWEFCSLVWSLGSSDAQTHLLQLRQP